MYEKKLHEKFVGYLNIIYPRKKELTTILADILGIERESVSRRLNGKVLFTVNEIGKISEKLDISLDRLLNKRPNATLFSLELSMPLTFSSINMLVELTSVYKDKLKELSENSMHIGYIFYTLPLEFFMPYSNLSKFMYFKWAYYFVKEDFFKNYTSWQIPPKILEYHKEIIDCWVRYETLFYIWDNPVIWNLMKEVNFLYKMQILSENDVSLIKKDLHDLLNNIEMQTRGVINSNNGFGNPIDLYISSVNIGATCIYYHSSNKFLVQYITPFLQSAIREDVDTFNKMYDWINSMKSVSTLISGSGAVERRLFFDEQHKIVDSLLCRDKSDMVASV